ncbi:DUF2125 domain-containing protein [Govanella unica]|uniref:DUF2125 domain-containing protein n=1 Tax=Govanella unica TaxID=2975056 RepID=A0A9X3TV37_9PROT|nr:DUF2125 domain-containing protein [Govania unica]MDA5192606.1 DUF2125 domain-containing protein [Govania unica]
MRFRIIIGLLAALLVGYSIYWYVTANQARSDIAAWIKDQQAAGHDISYRALEVGGYPYRIEVQVKDAVVKGHNGDVAWTLSAPHFAVVSATWKSEHKILFADRLTLDMGTPGAEGQRLIAEEMRASLVSDDKGDPARVSVVADSLTMEGLAATVADAAPGAQVVPIAKGVQFKDMQFHWRAAAEAVREKGEADETGIQEPLAWQIAFMSKDIHYPEFADSPYGPDIKDMSLVFEMRGLGIVPGATLKTIAAWRDQGGTLELTSGSFKWGKLDTKLSGSVTLDQQFRPLGAFAALVKGYEPLLDHLLKSGGIEHQDAATVKKMLDQIIAADTDNDGRLRLPLTMQAGQLMLGPLPIAALEPVVRP